MLKKLSNPLILLSIITLFGGFLRLFFLDRIPNAIGGDELNYILTAKAIWLYGSDLTKMWNPLSIFWFNYPPGATQAELPYLLQAPIVGPLPFSLFNARVLPGVLSILSIPLLFLIAKKLFNNQVGLLAAFFLAINPWSIYIGRTAYEASFVVFFFLVAFCVLLYFKSRKLLFSIPLLFAAFYSYIGTKLIFLPLVGTALWYSYKYINPGKFKKIYIAIFSASLCLVLFFAVSIFTSGAETRTGEILLPNSEKLSLQVDSLRRSSIQNPATPIFENKPVLFIRTLTEKLYKTFSFDFLFSSGDLFFSIQRHGLFYAIDLVFLVSGIWFMAKKKKRELIFLGILIFISTFPQLFHTANVVNFSFHLVLMYPLMLIVMAFGAFSLLEKTKFKFKYIIFTLIFMVSLLNFLQIYFFQHSLQGHFDFSLRTLSRYVYLASQKNPIIVFTPGISIEQKYVFYTNSLSKKPQNITFTSCPEQNDIVPTGQTIVVDSICEFKFDEKYDALAQLNDSGETYRIYNDTLCQDVNLKSYPSNIQLSDFLVEELPADKFCQTYVVSQ